LIEVEDVIERLIAFDQHLTTDPSVGAPKRGQAPSGANLL
jgi:hypothetical protein